MYQSRVKRSVSVWYVDDRGAFSTTDEFRRSGQRWRGEGGVEQQQAEKPSGRFATVISCEETCAFGV